MAVDALSFLILLNELIVVNVTLFKIGYVTLDDRDVFVCDIRRLYESVGYVWINSVLGYIDRKLLVA